VAVAQGGKIVQIRTKKGRTYAAGSGMPTEEYRRKMNAAVARSGGAGFKVGAGTY